MTALMKFAPDKMKHRRRLFQVTFLLFHICMLFQILRSKRATSVLSNLVSLLGLVLAIHMLLASFGFAIKQNCKPLSIALTCLCMVSLLQRLVMASRLRSLKKIYQKLLRSSTSQRTGERRTNRKVAIWLSIIAVESVILPADLMRRALTHDASIPACGGVFYEDEKWEKIEKLSVSFFIIPIVISPFHLYSVFFFLVCTELQYILLDLKHRIRDGGSKSICLLGESLFLTSRKVQTVDHKLRFLTFTSVIFTSVFVYFFVSISLYTNSFGDEMQTRSICILCVVAFMNLLAMVWPAVTLNDASLDIAVVARALPSGNSYDTVAQIRFFLDVRKEISMTIWGIGPITRSVILGLCGTILTYCILVDGIYLRKNPDKEVSVK